MNDIEVLHAVRERLVSLVVATTGSIPLASTTTGFTRSDGGSFLTDGLKSGMEVEPFGFADNTPIGILSVTATEILTFTARTVEPTAGGRSLTVGIPAMVSWENKRIPTIPDKRWYLDEDYVPGISWSERITRDAPIEHGPQWVGKLSGIAGTGIDALYTVSKAILDLFPPFAVIGTMADGHRLRVSGDPQPSRGPIVPNDAGRAQIVITIPLRKRS